MSWSSDHMISWRPNAENRHLQSHLPAGLLRPADAGRARLQGHRQADAQHPDAGRSRRALPRDGHVRGVPAGAVAADAADRGLRERRRRGRPRARRQRRHGGARRAPSAAVSRVRRGGLPYRRSRRRRARSGARHRRSRRARHPDVHQRPRHADLRAGVSADLRGAGGARPADLAAPVSRRGRRRLQGGGSLAVRNLVDVRLAVRDERGDGAPGVRRLLRPLSGAEDHHPPHGRDGAVLRRARRPGLGSAGRAHLGRGSLGACWAR